MLDLEYLTHLDLKGVLKRRGKKCCLLEGNVNGTYTTDMSSRMELP